MKKIRGQQQQAGSSESETEGEEKELELEKESRRSREEREAEAEAEAIDYSWEDPDRPRFERIRTHRESISHNYDENPYDIDRVNTRESFKRTASRASSRERALSKTTSRKSAKSWRSAR
jgi:hypothetical protein